MSTELDTGTARIGAARFAWIPVLVGLAILYLPTFYDLASWYWQQDNGRHGPIILAVIAWLFWRKRAVLFAPPERTARVTGYALLVLGLLVYVLGRSQQIALLEVGSMTPVLAGVLLIMRGWPALRAFWFPLLFVAFMVPLPGMFVDALTGPLKQHVSQLAEQMLYTAGYPVARSGVVLTIGQYQLLVADACSGLHSIFSLSALGLLYMYLVARRSILHNALMIVSIVPIAFLANVVRVVALMLITYYFGDAAGQGFLHGATGIVLLLVALVSLIALDAVLARILGPRAPS